LTGFAEQAWLLLPTRHDLHDLHPVPRPNLSMGEFGWSHRLAVVLHYDTAREQLLGEQEFLDRARKPRRDFLSIGNDGVWIHAEFERAAV
jgi:hypothetical protein